MLSFAKISELKNSQNREAKIRKFAVAEMNDQEFTAFVLDNPKQAGIVAAAILNEFAGQEVLESEIVLLINKIAADGHLKTKQLPARIYKYYRPKLIEAGIIS